MKKRWLAVLFGSMLVLGACGGDDDTADAPADDTGSTTDEASVDPEQVVQQNCISCHGENLEGTGNFPALNDVGSRMSEEEILDVILNGQGAMPPNIIEGEEAEAVAAYLASMQ